MTLNKAMRASSTGLAAERFRMDVISSNIANANSMRINGVDPYRARKVVLEGNQDGVRISKVEEDTAPFRREMDPGNPFADDEGFVTYSNVEPIVEMVNMMGASRAYEANIVAFNSARGMVQSALSIGRV